MIQSTGPGNARIMLVGELPHERDLHIGQPFVGGPGFELTKMLAEAGISRESCYITMVMKDRVLNNRAESLIAQKKKDVTPAHVDFNGKKVLPSLVAAVEELRREIELVKPNVIIAFGNLALFALVGQWGAMNWRSSIMESTLVPGQKVIPTISPALVMQVWSNRVLLVHDLKRAAREAQTPTINRPAYNFIVRPGFHTAKSALLEYIELADQHALSTGHKIQIGGDIETRAGHISCIAFAKSPVDAVCIPFMAVTRPEGYWTLDEEAELVHLIYLLCQKCTIIGQNWNYDAQFLWRFWHFLCPSVIDTMVQHHSCFSNLPKNLAFLSSMYLDDHLYWKDDRTGWEDSPEEGEDQYWTYNCTDSARTLAIAQVLKSVIPAMGFESVNGFQQHLRADVLKIMNRGLRVDTSRRAEFAMEILEAVSKRNAWLREVTGQELNIKSPMQMQDFFYRQMGMRPVINRSTGSPTCDDTALQLISEREPILRPVCQCISELRSLGVFYSTFIMSVLDVDGRMRTSFNICGTETYRFASSKNAFGSGMNMQNIPKGGETESGGLSLPNIRSLFIPDPNNTFFDIDLDSADLRIVTWESDCAWMKAHFKAGRKPYIEVMREYYQNSDMDKKSHPHEYGMFKSLCHGTNYLGTADGIAPRIHLDVGLTQKIQDWYFRMCPEIKDWQDRIKSQVASRRFVENAWGYRNYFFDRIEGTIFNQAVAWIPQSTVACLINRALHNIELNLPEVEVLLQVHDSLAGQFETRIKEWALKRIQEEATIAIPYADPLYIPVGIVSSEKSWGECG